MWGLLSAISKVVSSTLLSAFFTIRSTIYGIKIAMIILGALQARRLLTEPVRI